MSNYNHHGYRYSLIGPYNNHQEFFTPNWVPQYAYQSPVSFAFTPARYHCGYSLDGGSLQLMNIIGPQYPNYIMNNSYGSHSHPYNCNGHFNDRFQIPSSPVLNQTGGFLERDNSHSFSGTVGEESQSVTYYAPNKRMIVQYSKVPKEGDIFFCSRQVDNVLFLDFVSMANTQEHYSLQSHGYPRDSLYRAHEGNGGVLLLRMGEVKLYFPEVPKTATYYLPNKDIALHFTRVPRDGDVFSFQRNDNVLILDVLPNEDSKEHHKDLYHVEEGDGGILLLKMDNKNMPSEVAYTFGGKTNEVNRTSTYYLDDTDMVFYFTKIPSDGDIFSSRRSHNVMILDIFLTEDSQEHHDLNSSGNLWDMDLYRVQEGHAGFVLVKTTYGEIEIYKDSRRRYLKAQKKIASNNMCAVCLVAYKNDDRLESLHCGHEFHVSCIKTWLQKRSLCPICLVKIITSE